MQQKKTKIILDADVIIHFVKAESFSLLPEIFPEYEYIILDVVYDEVAKDRRTKELIDNYTHYFSRIKRESFVPKGTVLKDYFQLLKTFGHGESACMIYCREHRDVLGSSNLKDIKEYCRQNDITFLTTIDFLYYAFCRKILSSQECDGFIRKVVAAGSKLPMVDIARYTCTAAV